MQDSSKDNRRRTFRVPYETSVGYTDGAKSGQGSVENIGPDSMLLLTGDSFRVGDKIDIEFQFRNGQHTMNLSGQIVRIAKDGVGIKLL